MTTNSNESAAQAREEAAVDRDSAAQDRDQAAILRDKAAKRRDGASLGRHEEVRQDIRDTQRLVSGTGENVIFRVDGLQDKFFEHLVSATNAIEDATEALRAEKRTRKIQIGALAVAMVLGVVLGVSTFLNTMHIEDQAERSDRIVCLAINENRLTIDYVLTEIVDYIGPPTEEERALLEQIRSSALLPLDCDSGVEFSNP